MSHLATVQHIYDAFGRGDVPAILSHLTDDVSWDNSRVASRECPWNGNFSHKAHVPGFFRALADELTFTEFDVQGMTESAHHVAVQVHIKAIVKKTGKTFANDTMHLWAFDAHGRVKGYRHYNDTAQELAAWRGVA